MGRVRKDGQLGKAEEAWAARMVMIGVIPGRMMRSLLMVEVLVTFGEDGISVSKCEVKTSFQKNQALYLYPAVLTRELNIARRLFGQWCGTT